MVNVAYFINGLVHLDNLLDAVITIATDLATKAWCVEHQAVLKTT